METERSSRRVAIVVAACVAAALATGAHAGEWEPPGPPEPTMKPLTELEPRHPIWPEMLPFTIEAPGSYYLAAPALEVPGGITIVVSKVTVDLNGFVLQGNSSSEIGIDASTVNEVTVLGGEVRDFPRGGVVLGGSSVVRGVRAIGNGEAGIEVGSYGRVLDSFASGNDGDGIVAAWNSVVERCMAGDNRGRGIVASDTTVTGCTSRVNDSHGIEVDSYSVVRDNTCADNGSLVGGVAAGIRATGYGNRIDGNHLTGNDIGLQVTGSQNIVLRNTSKLIGQGTAYSISTGNRRGPIVDASAVDDLSTVTNGGHPWANFIF